MNHLAHFFLSGDNEDLAIGNFVADFISNRELPQFTEGVKRGIMLHREIDAFTDAHPVVKQSTKRLHPFHHKYSPVIVDIYYDFLLAKNWKKYAIGDPFPTKSGFRTSTVWNADLRNFVDQIYNLLTTRHLELPLKLRNRLSRMIADDWLMRYSTYEGLHRAFLMIEKHAAFPGNFGNAATHLEMYLEAFDAEFNAFFPDLQKHVKQVMAH
jgi:acyl carrier protein phosphodiesterase